mmetsp:Transcript_33791/g.33289  ORF Transcript_33791/g.33289 Transcript_33791/m.33289 type:complete len:189 (-) Transcript_33791:303-869(-)
MSMTVATSTYSFTSRSYSYSGKNSLVHNTNLTHSNSVAAVTETLLWEASVNRFDEAITVDAKSSHEIDEFVNVTCSIGGSTPISYTFSKVDSHIGSDWLIFSESNLSLTGTPPDSSVDKVYKYTVAASWTTTPSGTATTEITINAKTAETTTSDESTAQSQAGVAAEAGATASVGVAAGIAVINAALM